MMDKTFVKETVKRYVRRERYRTHLWWNLIKAIFRSVVNLFSLRMWYGVFLFFVTYCIGFALYYAIAYVVGGVCYIIEKIIHVINTIIDTVTIGQGKKIDVREIDALAGLVDGTCSEFHSVSHTVRYWIARTVGNSLCLDLSWYESITLTRWFVSRPLQLFYVEVGTLPGHLCQLSMSWDICAGVTGTKAILDFALRRGLWILLALIILSPCLRVFLLFAKRLVCLAASEVHYWLYTVQPRWKGMKHRLVSWWQRCHLHTTNTKQCTDVDQHQN